MSIKIDDYFDYLNELYDINEEQIRQMKFNKFNPLLTDIKNFLIKNKIILYGGTAINFYLPDNDKIYDELSLPDYDGFSINSKETAIEIADHLHSKKYKYIFMKQAIHDGTYNVSSEFVNFVDITKLSKSEYNLLLKKSDRIDGLYLCPVDLLKSNAYKELCIPMSALFRWGKTFSRVMKLEKYYKLETEVKNLNLTPPNNNFNKIKKDLINYIKKNNLPITGLNAFNYFTDNKKYNHSIDDFANIEILMIDTKIGIKDIENIFKSNNVDYTVKKDTFKQFIPNIIRFISNDKTLIKIHDVSDNCINVHETKSYIYSSKLYLLYILYFMLYEKENDNIKFMINQLLKIISKKDFSIICYGYQQTISAIKRSRWNKKPEIYYPSRKK